MATTSNPVPQFFDINGDPLVGGLWYFYAAGTTTPISIYSDEGLTQSIANPVVLNSTGEPDTGVYTGVTHKQVLKTADAVTRWTLDNIQPSVLSAASFGLTSSAPAFWGRKTTSGTGAIEALTAAEAAAELPAVITDGGTTAGTKGLVPAPAAGDAGKRRILTPDGWQDLHSLSEIVVPAKIYTKAGTYPNTAQFQPVECRGAGIGMVTMNKRPWEYWAGELFNYDGEDDEVYIDFVGGNDTTGDGTISLPFKTWEKAANIETARTIIPLPTGPYPPFTFDGTSAVSPQKRIKLIAPLVLRYPGPAVSGKTWTADTGGVWVTDLSGDLSAGQIVQRMYRMDGAKDSYGHPERLRMYFSLAAIRADGNTQRGMYFDATNLLLYACFEGLSIEDNKSRFRALYTDTVAVSALKLNGAVQLYIDATQAPVMFDGVGLQGIDVTTSLPTLLVEGRTNMRFAPGNGVHLSGGLMYAAGLRVFGSRLDNFNFDPSAAGVDCMAIGTNLLSDYAGDYETFQNDPGLIENRNAWSAHGGANTLLCGSVLRGSYGPNLADTTATGYDNFSWLMGVKSIKSVGTASAGLGFYASTGTRSAWVDECMAIGEARGSGYGPLYAENMTVKVANDRLNLPRQTGGTGAFTDYTRNNPG